MRTSALLCLALFAALSLSCATAGKSSHASSSGEGASPEADCLRSIAEARKHTCDDRPSDLSEGYAARARARHDELAASCSGSKSRYSLRQLDDCVAVFESEPAQIDVETRDRVAAERPKANELRADEVFQRKVRKVHEARDEADNGAEAYKTARAGGDVNELRFRKEAWDTAEHELKDAVQALHEALEAASIDPRDARALSLW